MKKLKALMIGSVPLSLNELQLAPAIIAAEVHNQGHEFQYLDINLDLYERSSKNLTDYNQNCELLQDIKNSKYNNTIEQWLENILKLAATADIFLVNVFSVLSQGAAYNIVKRVRNHYPDIKILMGGIGSHRDLFGSINQYNRSWLDQTFAIQNSNAFGQLMLDNGFIDDWEQTVSTDNIKRWFPMRPSVNPPELVNFEYHRISNYEWQDGIQRVPFIGSYGCVRRCSFCDVVKSFPKYGYVEADTLTQQLIETYEKTGIARVQFMDSLVNGSMSNFVELLKNLTHAKQQGWLPAEFSWSGTYICRPDSPRLQEIHQYLGSSGADTLIIGVETGSDKIRYSMDKKFTNADLLNELEHFAQQGVKCGLLFFPAWPTETQDDFNETLQLFKSLTPWAYKNTIEYISFGTMGFILTDGTPIYDERDSIGLESGPAGYLWKCKTNPTLTFWETMRRRMLMSKYSQLLGIPLSLESLFLRFLLYKLQNEYEMIAEYHGPLDIDIMPNVVKLWDEVSGNTVRIRLINSGLESVDVQIVIDNICETVVCIPGIVEHEFLVNMPYEQTEIKIIVAYPANHVPDIHQYDSGDYYSANGLYIDLFSVDGRDITLNGFNQMFNETVEVDLPEDYAAHCNERAIIGNTVLTSVKPEGCSLQEHISRSIDPDTYNELDILTNRIKKHLANHDSRRV